MTKMGDDHLPVNAIIQRKKYIIHGLGGIRKTQLALAYTSKPQVTNNAIRWLNGNSIDALLPSLAALEKRIPTGRPMEL